MLMTETQESALERLMGQRVTFYCMNYIYTGELIGVNSTCVLLTDAAIVYETGAHADKDWSVAQALPHDWYIQLSAVESFGVFK